MTWINLENDIAIRRLYYTNFYTFTLQKLFGEVPAYYIAICTVRIKCQ